jgi:hypothetical protein
MLRISERVQVERHFRVLGFLSRRAPERNGADDAWWMDVAGPTDRAVLSGIIHGHTTMPSYLRHCMAHYMTVHSTVYDWQ